MGEGQHRQTTVSWRKPVARADMICCPGDLIGIQDHALWISGRAGGHEADMAFDRWKQRSWVGTALAVALRSLLCACLLDKQFASLPGNNLGSSGTRKAPGLFRLFHKQHVWLVHTNCSCPFFLLGIGSQGDKHVPPGQRSEPEHRIGNPA